MAASISKSWPYRPLRETIRRRQLAGGPWPLFFLHIHKTAGSSLRQWLEQTVGDSNIMNTYGGLRPDWQTRWPHKRKPLLISGHNDIGYLDSMPWDIHVITVLREPSDQVRSYYQQMQRRLNQISIDTMDEFPTFVEFLTGHKWVYNYQTQRLAGLPDDRAIRAEPEKWLAVAKENLDNLYWFGLFEQIEVSVDRLNEKLGWSAKKRAKFGHFNPSEHPRVTLTEQEQQLLEAATVLDRKLYAYACEKFAAQGTK